MKAIGDGLMETTVAIIKKHNGGDVRVRIDELYGHRFVGRGASGGGGDAFDDDIPF